MKNKIIFLFCLTFTLTFTAFHFFGCATPPVYYSFAEDDSVSGTATIIFGFGQNEYNSDRYEKRNIGVMFVDFEGNPLPYSVKNIRHYEYAVQHITLPAGRPLELRVYIWWAENKTGTRRRGIFKCPPLEAGKTYRLWYHRRFGDHLLPINGTGSGNQYLVLTDSSVTTLRYTPNISLGAFFGSGQTTYTPAFEAVYFQEIPYIPGIDTARQ